MPAVEQRLADCIDVWGRRRIMLRGGNRGVAADVCVLFRLSYGDLKCVRLRLCAWFDGFVHQACCFGILHRQRESVFVAAERCLLVHLLFYTTGQRCRCATSSECAMLVTNRS